MARKWSQGRDTEGCVRRKPRAGCKNEGTPWAGKSGIPAVGWLHCGALSRSYLPFTRSVVKRIFTNLLTTTNALKTYYMSEIWVTKAQKCIENVLCGWPRRRNTLKMYYVGDQGAEIHWKCTMWVTKAQNHCQVHFHKLHGDHKHAQMLLYKEIWVFNI